METLALDLDTPRRWLSTIPNPFHSQLETSTQVCDLSQRICIQCDQISRPVQSYEAKNTWWEDSSGFSELCFSPLKSSREHSQAYLDYTQPSRPMSYFESAATRRAIPRYERVGALPSWEDKDFDYIGEVSELRNVLGDMYGFKVEEGRNPSPRSNIQPAATLSNWLKDDPAGGGFLILYYSGHGYRGAELGERALQRSSSLTVLPQPARDSSSTRAFASRTKGNGQAYIGNPGSDREWQMKKGGNWCLNSGFSHRVRVCNFIKETPAIAKEIQQVFEVASWLRYLHSEVQMGQRSKSCMRHMDIKPKNILVYAKPNSFVKKYTLSEFSDFRKSHPQFMFRPDGVTRIDSVICIKRYFGVCGRCEKSESDVEKSDGRKSDVWSWDRRYIKPGAVFIHHISMPSMNTNKRLLWYDASPSLDLSRPLESASRACGKDEPYLREPSYL